MKVYKRLIKPMILVPTSANDYSPKIVPIEPEKWYPEKEREALVRKYKHFETTFETLVFEDRYAEIEIPEIIRCKDCIHWDKGCTEECNNSNSVCYHNGRCKPDWFCADGERRDGHV